MTDDMRPTYWDCLNSGMTQRECADARGVSVSAVCGWANINGVRFKPVNITAEDIPADKYEEYRVLIQVDRLTQAEALDALGLAQ
jgi:hypothetical protein